ncbi:transposable element Tcb2 transposase [Trichonephila clavipes]|nr:transposable element Tcb2 transposase [Trichonephila clavipes]
MISDGTEFAVGDIEKLFAESRRNTKATQEMWTKYDRWRQDVRLRKSDKMEIITSSSDNISSSYKSNNFEVRQPRSIKSQSRRKNGSGKSSWCYFCLMDDNARPHRADSVDVCLEIERIARMAWPAYSSDLNPIETFWDALGRIVSSRFPPPATLSELETAFTRKMTIA